VERSARWALTGKHYFWRGSCEVRCQSAGFRQIRAVGTWKQRSRVSDHDSSEEEELLRKVLDMVDILHQGVCLEIRASGDAVALPDVLEAILMDCGLCDRPIILRHSLRFTHETFQPSAFAGLTRLLGVLSCLPIFSYGRDSGHQIRRTHEITILPSPWPNATRSGDRLRVVNK
jgi:hypothetical protein